MIGRTVSHYRIVSELGVGGMGVVYQAEDTRLGRAVALKFLSTHLAQDDLALDRFRREARATSALNHPHICTIYDIGEADGQPFIAMELLEGEPLRRRLSQSRLAVAGIVDAAVQLADALEAAHAKGIVHRDIKPENIFITTRGAAKLLDFGIATLAGGPAAMTRGAATTRAGTGPQVLGTVAYMSPEQARGEPLDARSDLFSLGAVLYEMATGTQAFRGTTSGAVLSEILTKAPTAPVRLNPDVPADLERIVHKLLEKDRELRYQSARDVRVDLERLRRTPDRLAATRPDQASILVLPFANLSSDAEQEYFSDGLTEEIIADLSKVRSLRVISRTSAMHYKGTTKPLPVIARELSVRHVLEGSVRRAGHSLRITAQLIDAATDAHLWAEKYAGTLDDVFDIQEKVSQAIVGALRMRLTPTEEQQLSRRPAVTAGAFDLYLRARALLLTSSKTDLDAAVQCLETGLREMGESALLHAGLGYAYIHYGLAGFASEDALQRATRHASLALRLDPCGAQAYFVLGLVACFRGDHKEAIRQVGQALALEPGESDALYWLGVEYAAAGRTVVLHRMANRLASVDPLHPKLDLLRATGHWLDGRFDQAAEACERGRATFDLQDYRFFGAFQLACAGGVEAALGLLDPVGSPDADNYWSSWCALLRSALRRDAAALPSVLTPEFAASARLDWTYSYYVAACYAMVGASDSALDWLENSVNLGFVAHPYFPDYEPFLRGLHGDPRFEALMARIKLEFDTFEV